MSNDSFEFTIETAQTLDTMLHQVLNLALAAIGAEAGSLMLVDNKHGILQIKARLGKPQPRRKIERVFKIIEDSIAGWVVKNRKSYLCPDVEKCKDFEPSHSGKNFLSLLSVPIIFKDKVLAVINADAPQKNQFTGKDRDRLESIAKKVAAPISEHISIYDAIAEVGFELMRLPKDGGVESVLQKIAQVAVRSLGADVVTLYQYIQERDEFPVEGTGPTIAGSINDPRPMRRQVYKGLDVPWTVVHERKSGFYSDVNEHNFLTEEVERPGDIPRLRFIKRENIKSMAALLLPYRAAELTDEEVVGVMFVNYRTPHEFNIDERSALATFADYAAIAILNARQQHERRRIEQMKIVESLSATFAHRMNNLAGTSRLATQILRERIDPKDKLALRQFERIEHESKLLLHLAERLALPFKETGRIFELAPVDIKKIINDELQLISPTTRHANIKVIKKLDENLPKVKSVEFQLQQVLHDTLCNAVEAMKEQNAGHLEIRVHLNIDTNQVEIEISDDGPGIPYHIRSRLFAPGVTTKKDKLGIGLWCSRTFMQATGGDLILKDTQVGKGTTFVLRIPCFRKIETVLEDENLNKMEKLDILIVDDEETWQEQFKDILADEHFSLETALNYEEALKALKTKRFKLAIIDIRLVDSDPENEDGMRLLAEIDKGSLEIKVILITGYITPRLEQLKQRASQSPRLLDFIKKGELDVLNFRNLVRSAISQTSS